MNNKCASATYLRRVLDLPIRGFRNEGLMPFAEATKILLDETDRAADRDAKYRNCPQKISLKYPDPMRIDE